MTAFASKLRRRPGPLALGLLVGVLAACSKDASDAPADATATDAVAALKLASVPADPKSVIAARESVEDGEQIAVVGRIKEFVDGMAAFTVIDTSLKSCAEMGDADHCPTPWDYCCVEPQVQARSSATVELRRDGRTIRSEAHHRAGLEHLAKVIVTGKAKIDDAGNLTVLADGFHVVPE